MEIKLAKIEQKKYHKINALYNRSEIDYKLEIGKFCRPEFELLKDIVWIGKEKIDGTNTCILYNCRTKEFDFHGRNVDYIENKELQKYLINIIDTKKFEKTFKQKEDQPDTIVRIFGESYGAGIQSGGRYSKTFKFIVFDIVIGDFYLKIDLAKKLANKVGFEYVPVIFEGTLKEAEENVIKGFTSLISEDPTLIAEGYVLIPKVELFNRVGERIITKIKHKDYKHLA